MAMVEKSSDETLIDLARHLGFQLTGAPSHIEPTFWRKGMLRLFISHLSEYREWAGDLQQALLEYGVSGFVAHKDIEPTAEWMSEIEVALSTCDALVALLHEGFHESKWTDQEIGFAMGRAVPVFSVKFGQTPYGFIGRFQAFNGSKAKPNELACELFGSFRSNKQTQKKMSDILIGLFEESGSFLEAKARIGYLEGLQSWDPTYASRILAAAETNGQVMHSFGVPARVKRLAEKWSPA